MEISMIILCTIFSYDKSFFIFLRNKMDLSTEPTLFGYYVPKVVFLEKNPSLVTHANRIWFSLYLSCTTFLKPF